MKKYFNFLLYVSKNICLSPVFSCTPSCAFKTGEMQVMHQTFYNKKVSFCFRSVYLHLQVTLVQGITGNFVFLELFFCKPERWLCVEISVLEIHIVLGRDFLSQKLILQENLFYLCSLSENSKAPSSGTSGSSPSCLRCSVKARWRWSSTHAGVAETWSRGVYVCEW